MKTFLFGIFPCVALGLTVLVSPGHLDGHDRVKFISWARGIFIFDGAVAGYIAGVHRLFKAHIVLGLTIIGVFAFTRLVHILSGFAGPVRDVVTRTGWQIA